METMKVYKTAQKELNILTESIEANLKEFTELDEFVELMTKVLNERE